MSAPSDSTIEPYSAVGTNSKGFALTQQGSRPVIIEYVDHTVGFYHVRDLETQQPYTIFRTSFMQSEQIPAKYRRERFERVAAAWGAALNSYPMPVTIKIAPLAYLTYSRILRDAREAKNLYKWTHPAINETLWEQLNEKLTVSECKNGAMIGEKASKFPPKQAAIGEVVQANETEFTWSTLNELEALCLLLDKKLISPVPNFVTYNLTPDLIASLEHRFSVGFLPHETNKNKWSIIV